MPLIQEYIDQASIHERINSYYRIAMNTSRTDSKILWANFNGRYRVQHGVNIELHTDNLNAAIDWYNNINIKLI